MATRKDTGTDAGMLTEPPSVPTTHGGRALDRIVSTGADSVVFLDEDEEAPDPFEQLDALIKTKEAGEMALREAAADRAKAGRP